MMGDDFTQEEIQAWEKLVDSAKPVRLNTQDLDRLIASQFTIISAIYRTQDLIHLIVTKVNKTGSAKGEDIVEAIEVANNATKTAIEYSRGSLRAFLMKKGEAE